MRIPVIKSVRAPRMTIAVDCRRGVDCRGLGSVAEATLSRHNVDR